MSAGRLKTEDRWRRPTLRVLGIVILGYAAWQGYEVCYFLFSYEQAAGTVLTTRLDKLEQESEAEYGPLETAYKPTILYEYRVGATRYTGSRYDLNDRGGSREWAEDVLRRYRVGAQVQVHLNPRHPDRAVLSKQVPRRVLGNILFATIGGGICLVVSVRGRSRRRHVNANRRDG